MKAKTHTLENLKDAFEAGEEHAMVREYGSDETIRPLSFNEWHKQQFPIISKKIEAKFLEDLDDSNLPKFKKDDYIVFLKIDHHFFSKKFFDEGVVYKQSVDCRYIRVYKDSNGEESGWSCLDFDKQYCDWRYATAEEMVTYDVNDTLLQ